MIAAITATVLLSLTIILYLLLVLGLPLGGLAMGGRYRVMPAKMRIMCTFAIPVQLFAIFVILQKANVSGSPLPQGVAGVFSYIFAVYFTLNILMNAVSRSKKEKFVMTPPSAITAACFWIVAVG